MTAIDPPRVEHPQVPRWLVLCLIAVVLLSYPSAILLLGPRRAIEIGNVIVMSLASGVIVAYAPLAWRSLAPPKLDSAAVLSVGIFFSWLGVMIARSVSIAWRFYGQPPDWLNSGLWGVHIALTCVAALCHLLAPEAVTGRVPTRSWAKIGGLTAFGVFMAMLMIVVNID